MGVRGLAVLEPDTVHPLTGERRLIGHVDAHDAAAIGVGSYVLGRDAQREAGHAGLGDELAGGVEPAGLRAPQARDLLHSLDRLELLHADRQGADAQEVLQLRRQVPQLLRIRNLLAGCRLCPCFCRLGLAHALPPLTIVQRTIGPAVSVAEARPDSTTVPSRLLSKAMADRGSPCGRGETGRRSRLKICFP